MTSDTRKPEADIRLEREVAEVYEQFFVPALFGEWAPRIADAAGIDPGQTVLDVACGTGVAAREAAARVGPGGRVAGIDLNDGMLAIAREAGPGIDWRNGRAEALPFDDASFDAVVSQFGLMFFQDRPGALREMWRVLRPGGRMAVAVWASLDVTPGYAAAVRLLQRVFGDQVADGLRAPFVLGDTAELLGIFADAGIPGAELTTITGTARFRSIDAWMHTDIRGWTLSDAVDDAGFETLLREARTELAEFATPGGAVAFASPAHIVAAQKP